MNLDQKYLNCTLAEAQLRLLFQEILDQTSIQPTLLFLHAIDEIDRYTSILYGQWEVFRDGALKKATDKGEQLLTQVEYDLSKMKFKVLVTKWRVEIERKTLDPLKFYDTVVFALGGGSEVQGIIDDLITTLDNIIAYSNEVAEHVQFE